MKFKKGMTWFWAIIMIILLIVSIVLIAAYYFGVFPRLTDVFQTQVFEPLE